MKKFFVIIVSFMIIKYVSGRENNTKVTKLKEENPKKIGGIIAYDCSAPGDITKLSTSDDECNNAFYERTEETVQAQLLVKKKYDFVKYVRCFVTLETYGTYCNSFMFKAAQLPVTKRHIELSYDECQKVIWQKNYYNSKYKFSVPLVNGYGIRHEIVLAGSDAGSSCTGGTFTDLNGQEKKDVQVYGTCEVRVTEGEADFDINEEKVFFDQNHFAYYNEFKTFHDQLGFMYWKDLKDHHECKTGLVALYTGNMTKVTEKITHNETRVSYQYKSDHRQFILVAHKEVLSCDSTLFTTQSASFFIGLPTDGKFAHKINPKLNYKNIPERLQNGMALFSYDRHLGTEFLKLKQDLAKQLCIIKKKNAVQEMKRRKGLLVLARGEVLYVKRCMPVEVETRDTKKCYQAIPVRFQGKDYFSLPYSNNLVERATEISCSDPFRPEFQINSKYYSYTNFLKESVPPSNMFVNEILEFEYNYDETLVDSNILSPEQLEDMARTVEIHLSKNAVNDALISAHQGVFPLDESLHPLLHDSYVWGLLKTILTFCGWSDWIPWIEGYLWLFKWIVLAFGAILFIAIFRNIRRIYKSSGGISLDIIHAYSSAETNRILINNKLIKLKEELVTMMEINLKKLIIASSQMAQQNPSGPSAPSAPLYSELKNFEDQASKLMNLSMNNMPLANQATSSLYPIEQLQGFQNV